MKLKSPFKGNEIFAILKEEVDNPPSLFRCLLTFNAHRYRGTSKVCGVVKESEFEVRNRKDPYLSIKAKGQMRDIEEGSEIEIKFKEPLLYSVFRFLRGNDRQAILEFVKENLKAEEVAEPQGEPDC